MRYLRSKRGLAGLGALAVMASVTLLVVLPALASSSALVQQPSAAGVTPVDVGIGGNATCSSVFPKDSALLKWQSYYNNNPGNGTFASGNNDNVSFGLALTNGSNGQLLAITSTPNVAISGIAVNGGADNDAFDYAGQDYAPGYSTGWVSGDSKLHAPAKNANQNYTISHLNICYRLLATISGKAFNDSAGTGDSTQGPIAGATIGVFDNTTGKFSPATTGADGMFSSPQPIGDTYTVCAKLPSTFANQSVPSGTTCGSKAGYVPAGYTVPLGSGGSSNNNFGFQSLRTISGQIYSDNNLNATFDPGAALTPNDATLGSGWVVSLYDTTSGTSTFVNSGTSGVTGTYLFKAAIVPNDKYKLCLTQPGTSTWVQTEPRPGAATTTTCTDVSGRMQWAAAFTGSASDVTQNFGNATGAACSSTTGMTSSTGGSIGSIVALMPQGAHGGCLKPNTFAFAAGQDPGNGNKNYVGVAVGDPTQSGWAPVVERITFPDPLTSGGVPTYNGLEYIAGSVTTPTAMQPCAVAAGTLLDATNSVDYGGAVVDSVKDLYLAHAWTGLRTAEAGNAGVTGATDPLPSGQTTCLISITITGSAGDNPAGSLVARVYTSADSVAWPH